MQASAAEILANFKRMDLPGLVREVVALVAEVRKRLDGVDLKGLAEQWKKTGAKVEEVVANPEIGRVLENLNLAATELRGTLAKLDAQIEPSGVELRETLGEARR